MLEIFLGTGTAYFILSIIFTIMKYRTDIKQNEILEKSYNLNYTQLDKNMKKVIREKLGESVGDFIARNADIVELELENQRLRINDSIETFKAKHESRK